MARKIKHEDHINHEAWAIPYGDLITLLLALFVCMYAVSSVNEGRFRVLADSLSQAFGGPPRSTKPIEIGDKPEKGTQANLLFRAPNLRGFEKSPSELKPPSSVGMEVGGKEADEAAQQRQAAGERALQQMAQQVQVAMKDLIDRKMVVVHREQHWLEVEIRTDILFASGASRVADNARPILEKLAGILEPFPNAIRIEGHTDNVPIATAAFPSNWELSAARAASVVHLFNQTGVQAQRMSVAGYGEYRPIADNASADGRNHNRRVVIVVMEAPDVPLNLSGSKSSMNLPDEARPDAPAAEVPHG